MESWAVLAIVVPAAVTIFRDLVALRRDAARRHNIERLVELAPTGLRVVDRTANGGGMEIVTGGPAERSGP
ncbi:hypothetical protein [Amycolatopsis sp. lyj-90]|uniref:hypothetical protein n=1 Tax=Amycolatopsis sp. lyj-90 TaxID=2789285 RepID=UPI00397E15BC